MITQRTSRLEIDVRTSTTKNGLVSHFDAYFRCCIWRYSLVYRFHSAFNLSASLLPSSSRFSAHCCTSAIAWVRIFDDAESRNEELPHPVTGMDDARCSEELIFEMAPTAEHERARAGRSVCFWNWSKRPDKPSHSRFETRETWRTAAVVIRHATIPKAVLNLDDEKL